MNFIFTVIKKNHPELKFFIYNRNFGLKYFKNLNFFAFGIKIYFFFSLIFSNFKTG